VIAAPPPFLVPVRALPSGDTLGSEAWALFHTLQDRHVPITPRLAEALHKLVTASEPATSPIWGQGYETAGKIIGLSGRFGRTEYWATLTDVFTQVVAEPILRHASTKTGTALISLHAADGPTATDPYQIAKSCKSLEAEVARLVFNPTAMPAGFWSFAGLTLLATFKHRTHTRGIQAKVRAPQIDPLLAQLVFEVEPNLPADFQQQRKRQTAKKRSHRERSGVKPREGGVTGVTHSRVLEDVGSAMATAFAYPKDLLVPHLVEDGFMLSHRPPKRRPSRDLLLLVLNEGSFGAGPSALVKAAWIDATLRLAIMLKQEGFTKSELGWTDLFDLGSAPVALSVEALDDQKLLTVAGPGAAQEIKDAMRHGLISRSPLSPDGFYAAPTRSLTGVDKEFYPRRAVQELIRECLRAGTIVQNSKVSKTRNAENVGAERDLSDYASILLLHVADGAVEGGVREIDWQRDRTALLQKVQFQAPGTLRMAEVVLPTGVDTDSAFRVASDSKTEETHFTTDANTAEEDAIGDLIGHLSNWVLGEALQAIYAS
jgi:hypothetical protein